MIITKGEARAAGATRYFTGVPCKHGHIAERRVINSRCIQCQLQQSLAWSHANSEKARGWVRRWYYANQEKILSELRAARAQNPKPWRASYRKWSAKNPEKIREKNRNTNAQRKGAPGSHTQADVDRIRAAQNGRCAYCRVSLRKVESNVDHIVPICRGGSNDPENLQILCAACNRSKWARDPIAFAQSLGLLL